MIKIPNYKILKKIGSGGMGDVYLAEHSLIKRKVAIKSLHSNLVKNTDFIKRFRKEGETLAGLDHPNIVRLNEYIEHDGGLFLIMEFVEGVQLDNYIKNETGPIPEKELVSLFSQVLDAITYAHKKDIIHRDIKPSNIFVTADKKVKILDFGIAKLASENKGITKTGVQVGTVTYMSPEQVKGVSVDKLTDIYSLGVTLFQMAVGKVPYDNTNAFNTQIQIVNEPFPKASEFYPGVSKKIEEIILKATQKKKEDRYQSCEEFKKDLNSKNVVAPKIEKPSTQKKAVEKKKISGINKVVLGVVLLGLIILSLVYFLPKKSENSYSEHYNKAIKYLDNEEYQFAADEFSACLRMNTETDSILAYRGLCYYDLEKYEKSIKDLSLAISLNPDEADYYAMRADAYDELEKYEEAIIDYTKAIDINPSDVYNFNFRGYAYYVLEKYQEAINDFTKAISIEPDYFSFLYRGISYYELAANNSVLHPENKRAIDDFTTVISLKPDNKLAYTYRGMAKQVQQIPFCTDFQKGCELGNKDACKWYNEDCNTEETGEETEEVAAEEDGAGEKTNTSTNTTSNNPTISAAYYINVANDYFKKGKYKLAIINYSSAIRIDPNSDFSYFKRALSKRKLNPPQLKGAIDDLSKAIKINNHSKYYRLRGISKEEKDLFFCSDFKKACELGDNEACEWYEKQCKTSNINKNQAYYLKKGMKFYKDRDYESAIDNYTKAIRISSVFADAYYQRGLAYFKLKRVQESIDDYTEAIRLFNNEPHNIKNLTLAFRNRAESKERIIGSDFCADFKKACDLGVDEYSCKKYKDCR